ncbi:hypothetical protein JCGZ_26564 [Jatropha curcas]|uniref:Uncharacterized protein n=1 Tax=Jatropha curcas TaxID=180498 RepID=A0A067JP02_JATCU|nr:hypothetical protein JCGZ_26564 [Jatropha curcas]
METKYISDRVILGRRGSRTAAPFGNLGVSGMIGSFSISMQSPVSQFQGRGNLGKKKDKKKFGSSRSNGIVCHKCGNAHKGGCNFDSNTCFGCH